MFKHRITGIRQKLLEKRIDAIVISSASNITYLTGYANFSEKEREAYLLIGKDFQYIITDARYSEAIKRQVPHFTLFERGHESRIENLLKSLKDKTNTLAVEEDNLTILEYKFFKKHFKKLKSISLHAHRSIKSTEEITKIKKACKIGDKAFEYIVKKIRRGITEKTLAWELEKFIKDQGGELSFPSIVAFGKNSSIPHHHTSDKQLTINDKLVLLDFGVKFENYCSDMTRTVFCEKSNKKEEDIYKVVLEAQQKAAKFLDSRIKHGKKVTGAEVDKIAREFLISKGFESIPHSLGHGIGLEVHEHPSLSPKSKDELKEGMIFSIEPGIYIPNFGGVRIEDLFVIQNKKLIQLTNASRKLIII